MKVTISFKHLEHTPALDQRIHEKSDKLNKFFEGNFKVNWTCWCDEQQLHWAEIRILGQPQECFAKASSDNLYKALDLVTEKIERQLEKQKTKKRNRIHNGTDREKFHQAG